MNENSFNVCSRCGGANPLSARYCYQCGYELKSPEAPVICTKCNTVNQGSANFCKRCGSKLPKAQSKAVCPQCSASNVAGATFCSNCGFDFNAYTMPSAMAVNRQIERQEQLAATSVVVTQSQDKKLTRKEKKRLKREEEERLYREKIQARKQAKIDKKQAKKDAKAQAKQAKKQVVQQQPQPVAQYPVVAGQQMPAIQYIPPVVQQIVVEPPKPAVKKHRIKNLLVFLIALFGLYFILLPEQIDFFKRFGLLVYSSTSVASVKMTGWDVLMAVLSNFVSGAANLSAIAGKHTFDSIEILIVGVIVAVAVVELVFILLAKIVGMITGKAHKGIDFNALGMALITGGAFAYMYLHGVRSLTLSVYAFSIPLVFLAIAIFNTKYKKD